METGIVDNLEYTIKRSDRKSIGLTVGRDCAIIVEAPLHVNPQEIEAFVAEKGIWLHQKLEKKRAINNAKPKRDFVNGQGFLYLGRHYRLKLTDEQPKVGFSRLNNGAGLRLRHGYFELAKCEKPRARHHFVTWYKRHTDAKLKERLPRYDKRIGVRVERFRVTDLGNRWASLSRNGAVNFNWRSIMAPIWVFDYILVHELSHMIERRHSKDFWHLVSRVVPDYEEHVRWLSENGASLDL